MELDVLGHKTFCYTGGRPFEAGKPTLVFIHGVLNDHSGWILQTRYFAHHGFNVLAPDLPGHCRSDGDPPRTVEQAADFVLALLDAAGVAQAALIGHSFGSLTALEVAARAPQRVSRLVMVGTAFPMKVSPVLMEQSLNQPEAAMRLTNQFSHALMAPPPSALGPGTWVAGSTMALMRRVLASNTRVNLFHTGFKASDSYTNGLAAMAQVRCPVCFILGDGDQMTPPRAAQSLIDACTTGPRVVRVPGGHQMMTEAPEQTLAAMSGFLQP